MPAKRKRWTNYEDRILADYPNAVVAEKLHRTPHAVKNRRYRTKNDPCPFFVISGSAYGSKVWFCEQGPLGHEGTCCGGRSQEEYDRLRAEHRWQ